MKRLDGKKVANEILQEVGVLAKALPKRVCFIQFGSDAASTAFVQRKSHAAEKMNIQADVVHIESASTSEEAISVVREAVSGEYDGIVVQLPLPAGINTELVINEIPLAQDIDMLSEKAIELFVAGDTERFPPVAGAVHELLQFKKISLEGKKVVVHGLGRLVGLPVTQLLSRQHVPYSTIDIETSEDEKKILLAEADVIITGVGKPHIIKPEMIKEGAVLIDAGTSAENGVLAGDVDPACYEKALFYTPVPGGVGPVTVAVLFRNLFRN